MRTNNITVLTCTKDRHDQLKQTMYNCNKINGFYKHLIIDWNSDTSLVLNSNENKDRVIYNVKNENRWWLTRAYNTGFHLVETEYVLKLDADVIINYEKFNNLDFEKYDLIVLNDTPNDPGNFLIKKELLDKINGFNEYMWEWGWSDHDLILRAKNKLKNNKYLDTFGYIDKIPHDNKSRSIVKKNALYKNNDLFFYALIKAYNNTNAFLSKKNLWTKENKLSYSIKEGRILVNHFYNIKELNFKIKIFYKYEFLKSFFSIYKSKNRIQKRIFKYLFFIFPTKLLDLLSLRLYPIKINK